jgi:hypothetical protein
MRLGLGDRAGARAELRLAGLTLEAGPTPEIARVQRLLAEGDSVGARELMTQAMTRHVLDPEAHAMLGGLLVNLKDYQGDAAIEAYAATLLAPGVGRYWWLMGFVQADAMRYQESRRSIERFFALGGGYPDETEQARRLLEWLRAAGPGGEKFQQSLHKKAGPPG